MKSLYKNLLITSFLVALATTAFPVFIPSYLNEIGLSNFEIGVSLALLYLTAAILSLFIGYIEEKINKIKILIISYFGYILLPIFYLKITGLISIFLVRIYDGLISSLRYVSRYSILESKKAYETGINVSLNESLSNIGCLLGPLIAGVIASYYGINAIFIIASIILFLAALYSLKLLKYAKHHSDLNSYFVSIFNKLFHKKIRLSFVSKELFRNKPLAILSLVFLLFAIIDSSKFMAVTLYMKSLQSNNFSLGLVGSSFFFFIFLFEIFSGYLEKKQKRNMFLTLGLLLCSFSFYLFSTLPISLYYFLFFTLLFSLGAAFIRPAIFANLVAIEKKHTNIGTGIIFFFSNIGATIGLIVAGLVTQISFALFFVFGSVLLFISSLFSLFLFKIK